MKKLFKTLTIVALCGATMGIVSCNREDDDSANQSQSVGGFDENGASNAVFSVSSSKKVRFSRGNLQYSSNGTHNVLGGGTAPGTWRFAENQYDVIVEFCYDDGAWGDKFAWGTSGWNSGAHAYQPSRPTHWWDFDSLGYFINDSSFLLNSLVGAYSKADWGVYNAISNGGNIAGMWRTLTKDEWVYLLRQRRTSFVDEYGKTCDTVRYTATSIKVGDDAIYGLVIFPDSFTWPQGGKLSRWAHNYAPYPGDHIVTNSSYTPSTIENWKKFENAGAIFLPISGISNQYWSSTFDESSNSWDIDSPTYVEFAYARTLSIGYGKGEWDTHYTYVEPEKSSENLHDGIFVRLVKSAN